MRIKKMFRTMAVAALVGIPAVQAQVPPVINYQGQLLDASGNPASGNFTMVFSIFDIATGGTALYTETQNVSVTNGVFNVLIGSVTPIPQTLFDGSPNRLLEITVDGTVLTPRRRFGSVPFAFNAGGGSSPWQIIGNDLSYNNGNVAVGGTLTGNIVSATTQFNIGNARVLSSPGSFNFFAGNGGISTTGSSNSFCGINAGVFNTTGYNNAFFGFEAGRNNNVGIRNSFFGKDAGRSNTSGNDNTFFGHDAGDENTTGNSNTLIGYAADVGTDNLTNATALGNRAFVESDNSLVLGSINGKNGATEDVKVGIGTTTPTARLHSQSSGSVPSFLAGGSSADLAVPSNNQAMQFGNWDAASSVFTEWMRIGSAGNVGIGTTNPGIFGGASKYLTVSATDVFESEKVAALELQGSTSITDAPVARIDFSSVGSSGPENIARILVETSPFPDLGKLEFFTHDGTSLKERMTITHTGLVGIGESRPSHPLDMASGAHVTTGGVWTNASSRTYKENIHALSTEAALSALEALAPVEFNYKVDKEETCLGFIAEDVPALVANQDRKGLSAMDIVAMLTKVVQHQQDQIAELQTRLKAMEK